MKWLEEHPEEADELEKKIREYFKQNNSYSDTVDIGEGTEDIGGSDEDVSNSDDAFASITDDDLITEFPEDL